MSDSCYVCTEPLQDGDSVAVLRDEDGHDWYVHVECMSEMEKVEPSES